MGVFRWLLGLLKMKRVNKLSAYEIAEKEIGVKEDSRQGRHSPRVINYLMTVGNYRNDETAWCAAFVNWCLFQSGLHGTYKPNARSFIELLSKPGWVEVARHQARKGDIVVLWREKVDSWKGHVGFFESWQGQDFVRLLGGNQDNSVCLKLYPSHRILKIIRHVGKDEE